MGQQKAIEKWGWQFSINCYINLFFAFSNFCDMKSKMMTRWWWRKTRRKNHGNFHNSEIYFLMFLKIIFVIFLLASRCFVRGEIFWDENWFLKCFLWFNFYGFYWKNICWFLNNSQFKKYKKNFFIPPKFLENSQMIHFQCLSVNKIIFYTEKYPR